MSRTDERPRAEADTDTDTVETFAADLRELRHTAGNPTLQSLSLRTHISKSVLSEAFSGRRLPTANTVRRLALALGDDESAWTRRREDLAARSSASRSQASSRPRRRRRRAMSLPAALWALAATATISAVVTVTISQMLLTRDTGMELLRSLSGEIMPVRHADPVRTVCARDAIVLRSELQREGTVLLTVLHSPHCEAMWAHASVLGLGAGALSVEIFPESDRYGGLAMRRSATSSASVHTRMVVGPATHDGVCAVASFDDGEDLAPPLCAQG